MDAIKLVIKKAKILFVVLLTFVLSFSQNCYAHDAGKEAVTIGTLMGGIGIGLLLSLFLKDSEAVSGDTPAPVSTVQLPVIMSSSIDGLLSVNNQPTTGRVVVKNANTKAVARFDATLNDPTGRVTIDPNSSCYGVTPAGGECEFIVNYFGNSSTLARVPVILEVGDDANTSDLLAMTAVDAPFNTFFEPNKDSTQAKDFSPYGSALAFASINKNGVDILYAGFFGDGVYKSTDGGASWIEVNNGLLTRSNKQVRVLHFIDSGPNAGLYAGTAYGVFQSTDRGASWVELAGPGLVEKDIWAISSVGDDLYVGTANEGVFKRDFVGGQWDDFNSGLNIFSKVIRDMHAIDNDLYIATPEGVLKRGVDDISWKTFNNNLVPFGDVQSLHSIGSVLYVTIPVSGGGGGVFRIETTNISASWLDYSVGMDLADKEGSFVLSSIGDNLYVGIYDDSGKGILVRDTSSSSSAWQSYNTGLPYFSVRVLHSVGNDLYAGIDGNKVFKRVTNDNLGGWMLLSAGLLNGLIYSTLATSYGLYIGTSDGVYNSIDDGVSWTQVNPLGLPTTGSVRSLFLNGSDLYAGIDSFSSGGVFKIDLANIGAGWTDINQASLPNKSITSLILNGNDLYVGTFFGGVLKIDITNQVAGWTWVSPGSLSGVDVLSLLLNGNDLYAGVHVNGVFKIDTTNPSAIWTNINSSGPGSKLVRQMILDGNDLYVGTEFTGVYKINIVTPAVWANINATGPGLDKDVFSMRLDGNDLYVGTAYEGVFMIDINTFANWIELDGIIDEVWALAISGNNLYAGTGRGIFKSVLN